MINREYAIFSGGANRPLAERIADKIGVELGALELKRFSDGEIWVKYDRNIRGKDVYLVQSTQPPAENIWELLMMIDAARRASASRITAVIPYFGYARQDRKDTPRVAIASKLFANLLTSAGADRVITMDLHAPQIQGFFDIPFDHLYGSSIFFSIFDEISDNLAVVSPDVGGVKMARAYSNRLDAELVVSDKRRPKQNVAEIHNIIGDVEGKDVLLVDDLIDTAGTFVNSAEALKKRGARKIYGAVTHPLLSGPAMERLEQADIEKLYVSDTIPLGEKRCSKMKVVSSAPIFAEAIVRTNKNESISSLFDF